MNKEAKLMNCSATWSKRALNESDRITNGERMKRLHILDNRLWIEITAMLIAVNGLFFYLFDGDGSRIFYLGSFIAGVWLLIVFLEAPIQFFKEHWIELLFCGVCAYGIVRNPEVSDIYSWIRLTEVGVFMVALTSNPKDLTLDEGKRHFFWMARILVILTFVWMTGSLLLQLLHMFGIYEFGKMKYYHDEVFGGLYGNGNRLAIQAFISVFLSLYLYKENKNRFDLVNIGIELLGIALSGCRSVLLVGLILAIANSKSILDVIKDKKKRRIAKSCLVSVLLIGIVGLIMATISKSSIYFQHGFGNADWWMDKLSGGRLNIWKEAYEVSKTSPVFGVGLNNIQATASQILPETAVYNARGYENAHNMIINLLAYTGYAGLFTVVLLFGKYLKCGIYTVKTDANFRVLMMLLVGLLLIDQLDIVITFSNYMPVYVFYMVLGLLRLHQRNST